jgi:hypothetical protein
VVAKAEAGVERAGPARLNAAIRSARHGEVEPIAGLSLTALNGWFASNDPWPCASPARLNLLRRLEATFPPLESENGATRVGIGVATGADKVFITRDKKLVEASRLIPLAMAQDTVSGTIAWSGHYLVDPWNGDGLVPLERYPRLQAYLGQHAELLRKRSTAQKNPHGWYRTIDRVAHALATRPKLYIPDIKSELNPVLDMGRTYPHHNLYFITSDSWDLEVLGGLLLSAIGQFFVESYGVRMRGGYLRFQAQYLRRIRVPAPSQIGELEQASLRAAFRSRDRDLATRVALRVYQVDPTELESSLER